MQVYLGTALLIKFFVVKSLSSVKLGSSLVISTYISIFYYLHYTDMKMEQRKSSSSDISVKPSKVNDKLAKETELWFVKAIHFSITYRTKNTWENAEM